MIRKEDQEVIHQHGDLSLQINDPPKNKDSCTLGWLLPARGLLRS